MNKLYAPASLSGEAPVSGRTYEWGLPITSAGRGLFTGRDEEEISRCTYGALTAMVRARLATQNIG